MAAQAESDRKAFKEYFDAEAARALGGQFKKASRSFDDAAFVRAATKGLSALEFNARVAQFGDALASQLPDNRDRALAVLIKSLPEPLPDCESVTDGWLQWPLGQFIADHCVENFDASMDAMTELTQRFSSEYAVRPFVERYQDDVFERFAELVKHPNPHVRRWCSEGVRTRLPWGRKLTALIDDPAPIIPVLDALKDDPELYVRRSVANNLNDVSKDHPDLVIATCRRWVKGSNPDRDWTIKHALRSLVKDGNPDALALTGFKPPTAMDASLKVKPKRVAIGDSVELACQLKTTSTRKQSLMIDFVVHYVRKNGSTNEKVFKWKVVDLAARGELELNKKLAFKKTTIRALYAGKHRIDLQVNGKRLAHAIVTLTE